MINTLSSELYKNIIKLAFIFSPIISLLIIVPVFAVTQIPSNLYILIFFIVSITIIFIWSIHLLLIYFIKKTWVLKWPRLLITCVITSIILFFTSKIIVKPLNEYGYTFTLMRIINGVMVNLIVYVIIELILTKNLEKKLFIQNSELKYFSLETEYKLLKSQLNPHFIFNSLETIKYLSSDSPEKFTIFIDNLSEYIRACIQINKEQVLLKEEIELLQAYVRLQSIRFENKFSFINNVTVPTHEYVLPFFSLILLFENALKHNVLSSEKVIDIKLYNDTEYLIIENTLFPKGSKSNSTGIGIENLKKRYMLYFNEEIIQNKTNKIFQIKLKLIRK